MSTRPTPSAMTLLDDLKFRLHCLREIGQCAHGLALRPEHDSPELRTWAESEDLGVHVSELVPPGCAVLTQADPRNPLLHAHRAPVPQAPTRPAPPPQVTIIPTKQSDLYS